MFYFRWSLRNWADKYNISALKALFPGLKPGGRVVIQDTIMPEPGAAPLLKEKNARLVCHAEGFDSVSRGFTDLET